MAEPCRILIVEDDAFYREALVRQVCAEPDFELIGEVDSVAGALGLLSSLPDLVILDLELLDGSGLQVISHIKNEPALSAVRIIVLTLFADGAHVVTALAGGANGYLLKDEAMSDLVSIIRQQGRGDCPVSSAAAGHLLSKLRKLSGHDSVSSATGGLTPREFELLQLIAKGRTVKDAADTMRLSPHTAADYLKSIYRKLGVKSRRQAVFAGVNANIINL